MQAVGDSSGTSTGLRYVSVCDGIGAAHVAWQPLGWQCQWTSEIEPFPVAVVEDHYGFRNLGDMTKITEDMIDAPVDLLVGGTPCQSFSVAGLRGGLADPRGNLALRFVQLAAVMQPKWIVWENVPGVLSSGKGRDFGTFLGALGELGYGFAYRILDAQWFGVAQRRRRVFVVGYLGDWRRAATVLFERESVFGNPPTRGATGQGAARSTAASLTSSGRGVERPGESRGQDDVVLSRMRGFGDYAADGTASALKRRDYKDATDLIAEPQAIYSNESRCDSPSVRIGRDSGDCLVLPMAVRRLTPRECERLQGFPDDYTLVTYRGKPACDGPRYRALGNSMAVPVMRWIGERIRMVEGQ
jgi:DNA (cytosine-5)-methyltransferase 1